MEAKEEVKTADEEKPRIPRVARLLIGTEFVLSYITTTQFYFLERLAFIYLKRIHSEVNQELNHIRGFASVLSFIPAWLADCYFGKYWVFTITYVISCFWPISIFLLVYGGVSNAMRYYAFKVSTYFTVVYYSVEGVRFTILSEQMELPQQEHNIPLYFSLLYLARNIAGVISTSILSAHGHDEAFLMSNSVIIIFLFVAYNFFFVLMRKKLKGEGPVPLMYSKGIACLLSAIRNWIKSWGKRKDGIKRSLMDYAGAKHDIFFIYGWKAFSHVSIFCVLSIFVGMTEISYRNFTISQLDRLLPIDFLPSTYYVLDIAHFCGMIWIILWNLGILPTFHHFKITSSPLYMFMLGFLLTGTALLASLAVEINIEKLSTNLPGRGYGQLRVFNSQSFVVGLKFETFANESLDWAYIPPRGLWTLGRVRVIGMKEEAVTVKYFRDNLQDKTDVIKILEMQSLSYIITAKKIIHVEGCDPLIQGPPGMNDPFNPRVYILCGLTFCFGQAYFKSMDRWIEIKSPATNNRTSLFTLPIGVYNVTMYYSEIYTFLLKNIQIEIGGVYAILIYKKDHRTRGATFFTVVNPNKLSMAIVIPQIFLYTCGYLLCRIYGFIFLYTQSPPKLRCTFWNFGLYAYAASSLMVYLDRAYWHPRTTMYQVITFIVFHYSIFCIFLFFAFRYKYQTWCPEGAVYQGFAPLATRYLSRERKQMSLFKKWRLRKRQSSSATGASTDSRQSASGSLGAEI